MVPEDAVVLNIKNSMEILDDHVGHISHVVGVGVRMECGSNGDGYTFLGAQDGVEDV